MRLIHAVAVLATVAALFVTPLQSGEVPAREDVAATGTVVFVDALVMDPEPLIVTGGQVVASYGNGYFLFRVPRAVAADLNDVPGADTLAGRTTIDLYFSGTRFDTAQGEPAVPDDLRAKSPGTYLLQFIGPIMREWVTELEGEGLTFDGYYASYAFVVQGSPAAIDAARASPFVQWIGTYHPAYKVSSDLLRRQSEVEISVSAVGGTPLDRLAAVVTGASGSVEESWDYPPTVIARIAPGRIPEVAQDGDVVAITEYERPVPMDRIAGQIHKFSSAWYTGRSGLSSTLTGRSPGTDGTMYNADDYFEGAGIMDTGFDENDATDGPLDFFDSPNGDRVARLYRHSGPAADGQCGSAHGTHVAGIIASDGYSWETYLIENVGDTSVSTTDKEWHKSEAGVAPEAKISVDGVQSGTPPFCGGLATSIAYWDCQYLNGFITAPVTAGVSSATCGAPWIDGANVATHNSAIDAGSRAWFAVHSNSWGTGSTSYDPTYAGGSDTRMNNWPERIIVIAAGNGGPDYGTVSGTALGKNGLTVGASQNYRPEQFESDNPNLIAGFSSRGSPTQSGGRIKPDLVTVGTSVVSLMGRGEYLSTGFVAGADLITWVDKYCSVSRSYCPGGDGYADYRYLQGTSMATPHAAGLAILVREYLREVAAGNNPVSPFFNPPSYLVKALMVNGAVRMDPNLYEYPGYDQGWGRVDLEQSLFPPVPRTNQFTIGQMRGTDTCDLGAGTCTGSSTIDTGALNLNVVGSDVPLKVTLVWLDAAGDALSRFVDLRVIAPSTTEYHGNQYLNGWTDPADSGYDNVNTVEQVEVQAPETGTWRVEVRGVSIPSTARFALVFSGNVGPSATYKVDLSTTAPTTVSLAPLGSASIPLTVLNYGTVTDTIGLSSTAPAGLTVTYYPVSSVTLGSSESQDVLAVITASGGISPGVYCFDLRGVSQTDPSPTPASDFIPVCAEVLNSPLPFPLQVTNGTVDELDPSVLVFDDPSAGRHIFITYRKTSRVDPGGLTGGINVWVAHTTLDGNGQPVLPFVHTRVSNSNEDPNDLRIIRLHAGNLRNRVVITWTGSDPAEPNPDATSWSRVAYLDPPYSAAWTVRMIQKNEGSTQPCNTARVSFPLFRSTVLDPDGQLIYVWETLANTAGCTTLSAVTSSVKVSTDGGATWGPSTQIFPPPGNANFYFFPGGVVDQNEVAWVFAYWRTPTGNDRDLTVRLFDDAGWSAISPTNYTILDTADNAQWPAAVSTNEGGAGNRVYVAFTRDNLQADLKQYLMYTDKDYTSASPPRHVYDGTGQNCGVNCWVSSDFAPAAGSGLKGPYGTSVSNANYNRRPILNIVQTTDGIVWLPHMENANPYGTPNLWTRYSGDGFSTEVPTILTADAFSKGHQMSNTLTVGGTPRVYEVYHSSRGTVTQVNYEVYLLIYFANWPAAPDTLGPLVTGVAGTPNPVNRSAIFRITANLNDLTTGKSNVVAAEYFVDAAGAPGTGAAMSPLDGAWDSATEGVFGDVDAGTLGWGEGECHPIFVRGRDAQANWGPTGTYDQCTIRTVTDPIPPVAPTVTRGDLSGGVFQSVDVTWDRASDEGTAGGTVLYRVYRATGLAGGFVQVSEIPAAGAATYSYTDAGAGDGDPNIYLYRITSVDGADNESPAITLAAKFTRPVIGGWNLVSVPVIPSSSAIGTIFQTVSWNRARTFVATDGADPWKSYFAGRAYNDLTTVDYRQAVWVNTLAPDAFVVAGLVPTGTTINLVAGWNFVGFPSLRSTPYTVANLKAAVPVVTAVEGYDAVAPYYLRRMLDTDALQPGYGYWVYTSAAATWVVP